MTLTECDFIKRDDTKMEDDLQIYTFPDPLFVFGKVDVQEIRVAPKKPFRWPFVSRREYEAMELSKLHYWLVWKMETFANEALRAELQKHRRKRDDKGRFTK